MIPQLARGVSCCSARSCKPRAGASGTAAPQTSRPTSATADTCRTRPEPDPPVSTGGFLGVVREHYHHAAGGAAPSIKPRAGASGPAAPQTSRNTSATADNCRTRPEPDPPVSTGGFLGEVREQYRHAAGGASPSIKPRAGASGTAAPQSSRPVPTPPGLARKTLLPVG